MRYRSTVSGVATLLLGMAGSGFLSGCHSAFVQATVVNQTSAPIRIFEVDYPSASFGSSDLAPGAQFHTRFKISGTGLSKIVWTDQAGNDHTGKGPEMRDGEEGTLVVTLGANGADWDLRLSQAASHSGN